MNEKRELWIGWWTLVVFYNLYGLLFFVITRTQPLPQPALAPADRQWSPIGTTAAYGTPLRSWRRRRS